MATLAPTLQMLGWLSGGGGDTFADRFGAWPQPIDATRMRRQSQWVAPPEGDSSGRSFGTLDPQPVEAATAPTKIYNSTALTPAADTTAASSSQSAQPAFWSRLGQGINDNSAMLLAMAQGLAGAPSIGIGMGRAFGNAAPFAQANQTVQALMRRGFDADTAQLIANNPQTLNQVLPRVLGAKQWKVVERTDAFGQKIPFLLDEVSGQTMPINFSGSQSSPQRSPDNVVPPPEARAVGKIYQTPRGPARWLGNGQWQVQ